MFWNKCTNINPFLSAFKLKQFLKSIINFFLEFKHSKDQTRCGFGRLKAVYPEAI